MPLCDQTGTPGLVGFTHFHSSTILGSADMMTRRTLSSVFPRQSPNSFVRLSISAEALLDAGRAVDFFADIFLLLVAGLAVFVFVFAFFLVAIILSPRRLGHIGGFKNTFAHGLPHELDQRYLGQSLALELDHGYRII